MAERAGGVTRAGEKTADALIYAASLAPQIADSVTGVDQAMRWGFNFDMGSFEVWDALLQHPAILQKVLQDRADAAHLPELVRGVTTGGQGTFYTGAPGQRAYFDFNTDTYRPVPIPGDAISLEAAQATGNVLRDNGSASRVDLGDEIACGDVHTKMYAHDGSSFEML